MADQVTSWVHIDLSLEVAVPVGERDFRTSWYPVCPTVRLPCFHGSEGWVRAPERGRLLKVSLSTLVAVSLSGFGLVLVSGTAAASTPTSIPVGESPVGDAVDATTGTVYVANQGSNSVSVIDEATNTVTASVPVGSNPVGVAVDQATDTVYVTNSSPRASVSVIDGATDTVTATISVGSGHVRGGRRRRHRHRLRHRTFYTNSSLGDRRGHQRRHRDHIGRKRLPIRSGRRPGHRHRLCAQRHL